MDAAVISELEVNPLVSIKMRLGRVSSIGRSGRAVIGELRSPMRQVIGRVLQRGVSDIADLRIGARVLVQVRLEREAGVVLVAAQRGSERSAHSEVAIR